MIERFLATYGAAVAARILSFGALIASVRLLGNEANGQLVLCFSLAATALVVVLQGQRSGIVYFLSRREIVPSVAFSNAALFALVVGGLGALVLLGLAHMLPDGPWRILPRSVLVWICVAIPCAALRELVLAMSRGLGSFSLFNLNQISVEALKLLAIVVLAGPLDQGFAATAIGVFALEVLWSLFVAWQVRTIHGCRWSPDLDAFRKLQSYGSRAAIVTITSALHRNVDKFMIVGLLVGGASRLTEYHIALAWLLPVTMLSGLLSPVFLPRLADDSGDNAARLTAHLIRTLWFLGALSLTASCIVGIWLVPLLFGEENRAAVQPMLLLAPGILGLLLTSCVTTYLASRRDFRFWIRMGIVALLANVALNWLLIPRFGIQGVAMATTLTYSLECVGLLAYFKHQTRVPLRDLFLLRPADLEPIWKPLRRRRA